jgi:hypothetical protein
MVLARGAEVEKMKEEAVLSKKHLTKKQIKHPVLNFILPHELGGMGDPLDPKYL